jgi:uncharacterized membrane protein
MTDTAPQSAVPPVPQLAVPVVQDEMRTVAIVIYILYLAAVISAGVAGIVGVIVAYIKRDDAKGTIWESHFANQIEAFWVWLVLAVVGVFTIWVFGLGLVILGIAFIWFLYRTIKGLLRAVENKPYI